MCVFALLVPPWTASCAATAIYPTAYLGGVLEDLLELSGHALDLGWRVYVGR